MIRNTVIARPAISPSMTARNGPRPFDGSCCSAMVAPPVGGRSLLLIADGRPRREGASIPGRLPYNPLHAARQQAIGPENMPAILVLLLFPPAPPPGAPWDDLLHAPDKSFKGTGKWYMAGDAKLTGKDNRKLAGTEGKGVFINGKDGLERDLYTKEEYR